MQEVALLKRFCERWAGDATFRQSFQHSPREALDAAGLPLTPEQVSMSSPAMRHLLDLQQEKLQWRKSLRGERLHHPGLDAWRRRQMQRCAWQLSPSNAELLVHAPAAFELSQGCSVGCRFCGVSAARLSTSWPASQRELWRQIVEVVAEFCGPALRHSVLYWATDPLDNPDYEDFARDFQGICGAFPQTTTALALKDVERTRALLRLSEEQGCRQNRFSVLTLKQLLAIHHNFSPLELLHVELVLHNKEARTIRWAAGRARDEGAGATIACVSGFLFQLPARQVRWISPCPASERWPEGYRVHGQAEFSDASELREQLRGWARSPARLTTEDRPRWRSDLKCHAIPPGFRLESEQRGKEFSWPHYPSAFRLGQLLGEGGRSVQELCLALDEEAAHTVLILQQLYQAGLFDDGL